MKLHIEHTKEVYLRDINGKVLLHRHRYYVYKKVFGFIRRYINVSSTWKNSYNGGYDVTINWTGYISASYFGTLSEAEEFIKCTESKPERFITYQH